MKNIILVSISIFITILLTSFYVEKKEVLTIKKSDKVSEVLTQLGDRPIQHRANTGLRGVSAKTGADLALYGITKNWRGKKTKKQSKHFVCTSCHNTVKEVGDLRDADPQNRLEYAKENGLPFLQGSSLYGIVNRTSFYNGDYDKKYGKLVDKARNNIREAIQLCAVECAQGRRLKSWELESVLAWLWTMELKMEDLNLSEQEYAELNSAVNGDAHTQDKAIDLIKSRYQQGSPATFTLPPDDRKNGYGLQGNPDNGKLVYELSCQHCHKDKRYSYFNLDDSKSTFKYLTKHFPKYSRYSVYQVGRYGTPPMNGKKAYMPQYTQEKMSDQQMEDLRAYVEQQAR